ncbi:MAG: ATPase domain-containing protein [Bacillota bacterium]
MKTGIKNLDHILNGGIPVYSLNVVSGSPGSGKTIFIQNIIFYCYTCSKEKQIPIFF